MSRMHVSESTDVEIIYRTIPCMTQLRAFTVNLPGHWKKSCILAELIEFFILSDKEAFGSFVSFCITKEKKIIYSRFLIKFLKSYYE